MSERIRQEDVALRKYFTSFRIQTSIDAAGTGVVGKLRTNSGQYYGLWIPIGAFPNEAPKMYIVSPKALKNYYGQLLSDVGVSSAMHLLAPDEHGHPQICHYNGQFWHPRVSLYKIVFKGRLWLEAYENHMRTGKPIDAYLTHMVA